MFRPSMWFYTIKTCILTHSCPDSTVTRQQCGLGVANAIWKTALLLCPQSYVMDTRPTLKQLRIVPCRLGVKLHMDWHTEPSLTKLHTQMLVEIISEFTMRFCQALTLRKIIRDSYDITFTCMHHNCSHLTSIVNHQNPISVHKDANESLGSAPLNPQHQLQ